jgi:vancomycin permeability regulator SanA
MVDYRAKGIELKTKKPFMSQRRIIIFKKIHLMRKIFLAAQFALYIIIGVNGR